MSFTSFLFRGCAVTAMGAGFLLPSVAFGAPCQPARVPPSPEYLNLVTRYASGEHAEAVLDLGAFSEERLRCDLDNLEAVAVAAGRCRGACEDRRVFENFSLRAAILMHAEREIFSEFGMPVSEQPVRCRTGPQAQVVERLAGMLILADPEAKTFLSRFYVAMVRRAQWSHCIPEAEQWARSGLKRLPKDGTLLMSLGVVLDTIAFLTLAPAPRASAVGARAIRQFESQSTRLNGRWSVARRAYEDALAADPSLHEARLRLGRVLWRLDQAEPARACFEEVLWKSQDRVVLYLAHLFLGRIHEDQNRPAEAEKEYQEALALRPVSEAAAVAISHVRLLMGDPEGAREALNAGLEGVRLRIEADPFKTYPMSRTREGQTSLEELRKALRR